MDQYSRLRPLIGSESLAKLAMKKVAIFGLGGVGGSCVDALARSGIMNFVIIDNDVVSITNINRQLIANLNTVGKAKVDVMEEHLKSINKDIKVTKKKVFYLDETKDQFDFSSFDYVIDCIDTVSAKISLVKECQKYNVPLISALGCGNKMDPTKLKVGDIFETSYDPLAKVMRYELRRNNIKKLKVVYSTEQPLPFVEEMEKEEITKKNAPCSTSFVPPVAGIIIASEVIKDLLNLHP